MLGAENIIRANKQTTNGDHMLTALTFSQIGNLQYSMAQGARKLRDAEEPGIAAVSLRSAGGTEAM